VDRTEIESLRIEKDQLLTSLKECQEHFISIRTTVNKLAAIIERQIELADSTIDPLLTVNQISTYITGLCRARGLPISDNINHLLPNKYKDPNKQNFLLEDSSTQYCTPDHRDAAALLQELGNIRKEDLDNLPSNMKIIAHDEMKRLNQWIETDATDKGYQLNGMPDLRSAIKTRQPWEKRPTTWGNALVELGEGFISLGDFVNTYPPPPELESAYIDSTMTWVSILKNWRNIKYSLTDFEWLMRDMYRMHQSKHGAAVKDKVETTLCRSCSKLDREKYLPSDFVEMEWDYTSRSHWRCPECHGEDGVLRGLTREQCGDIAIQSCPHCHHHLNWDQGLSPIESRAIEFHSNLPIVMDFLRYLKEIPRKVTYGRKVKLGVDLSSKA
jgi:hypothetical protein